MINSQVTGCCVFSYIPKVLPITMARTIWDPGERNVNVVVSKMDMGSFRLTTSIREQSNNYNNLFIYFCCCCWDRFLYSSDFPATHYVPQGGLQIVTLLPWLPKCWNFRQVLPPQVQFKLSQHFHIHYLFWSSKPRADRQVRCNSLHIKKNVKLLTCSW